MTAPLAGARIVELASFASGPFAAAILADQGADVVKIEAPGRGDPLRRLGTTVNGLSAVFATLNRNKRSAAIDVRVPAGADIVRRLAAGADVFIQNLRPGVADRLGLGEAVLRRDHPELVYMSISGFGATGPYASRAAYDSVVQAAAGIADNQGLVAAGGEPQFIRNAICDKLTGLTAAQLATAALYARAHGHGGQHVEVSMLHATLGFLWPDGMQDVAFLDSPADNAVKAEQPPLYRTSDGYLAISLNQDDELRRLAEVVGAPELATDPRFARAGDRSRNLSILAKVLAPLVARWSTAELDAAMFFADVPHAAVSRAATIHEDEQVVHERLLAVIDQPPAGRMRQPVPVGRFAGEPLPELRPAPRLGEHTDEVLGEVGLDETAIRGLRADGVVG